MFVTERYIVLGAGECAEPENRVLTKVAFNDTQGSKDFMQHLYPPSRPGQKPFAERATPPEIKEELRKALLRLFELRDRYDAITIGSWLSLKSSASRDRDIPAAGYGVIANYAPYFNWNGIRLYEDICSFLLDSEHIDQRARPALKRVYVRNDTSLAALGEYHWRLARRALASPEDMLHIDLEADSEKDATRRAGRQATLAYVKLSTEVNAAVAFEGDLLGGKNHPYVHIVRPPRYQTYDGEFDKFRGVCQYHLDCYAGLVSGRAIQKRLDELYRLPAEHLARLDECDRRPGLPATQYSRNHPIWELVCYYMAHLCTVVLATHVPSLIVIGGRYIHDRLDPDETERALPQRIGAELVRQLSLDKPSVEVPHYPDLQRTDDFIQRALCELPGVYGALVLGARKIGLSGRERAN